ncbi:RagB/SusD family nutrient uptake outer membrane protein [Pedobacter sp. PWIIR3]
MRKLINAVFLFFLIIIASCEKFVQIDPPDTSLIASTTFSSDGTVISALVGIYANSITQSADPFIISRDAGLSADELKSYSLTPTLQQIYRNNLDPFIGQPNNTWAGAYYSIYQCNAIILGCSASSSLSPKIKKQVIAEAQFMRAFWYFYLVNFYGNVPLVTGTDYISNKTLRRESQDKIYEQIVSDLSSAKDSLSANYVEGSNLANSSLRVRANKSAAAALLARVYLYTRKYSQAEVESSFVIDNTELYAMLPLSDVFKANSKEAILQFMLPQPNYFDTPEGIGYVLYSRPSSGGSNSNTISTSLLNAFENGDLRLQNWIGKVTDETVTPNVDYFFPYKYKETYGGAQIEQSTALRLSEQYLIRAEARVQQNKLGGAISDLDVIRNRAGLALIANVNPTINKENLLSSIYRERRVELFTEWGHRWLDLKRTGKIDEVMTAESVVKGSTWNNFKQYYPIPRKEIQNNPNIVQNDGYIK